MNVLFAAVEMSPLAKVGGLGDVTGSLPRALRMNGDDVRVAMPMHGGIERAALNLTHLLAGVRVPWRGGDERVDVWQTDARGVPVYLLEHARYFGRPNVYGFADDRERFLFFCDALLACAPHLGFRPDVVHAQDWHTALLLTRLAGNDTHPWSGAGRVYTIHNLALRGDFEPAFAREHGISPAMLIPPDGLAPVVARSAMAQGIMQADRVNTVSDTYAKEILTPEYGAGLDGLLRARASVVSGIVNGIDYEEFDPETDPALAQHFGAETLDQRIANKRALQEQAGLPAGGSSLLFATVTRLFAQKGIDLVAKAFTSVLASESAQLIVLGTGDADVHQMLSALETTYPGKTKVWFDFNPKLGQQIYGGCDVFLMPSRYEPCGLGQLISLRYGAVPLVRRTGGLADTVQNVDLAQDTGTGFVFDAISAAELGETARRAVAAFADAAAWRRIQERGMRQDWSWSRAAGQYRDLYAAAIADRVQARNEASA